MRLLGYTRLLMKINLGKEKSSTPRRASLLAVLFLFTLLLGTLSKAEMLIDGEEVNAEDHLPVFGMRVTIRSGDSTRDGQCTAFLVAPRLLLTAAHCLQSVSSIGILANGSDLNSHKTRGTQVSPVKFAAHPEFVLPFSGMPARDRWESTATDIGYITLKDPAPMAPLSVHVTKDFDSIEVLKLLEVTLVGYGATKFHGTDGDYSLDRMLVKHMGKKIITTAGGYSVELDGEKNGALPGDSGGPEIAVLDGIGKVVALNHCMLPKVTIAQRVIRHGKNKGQTVTQRVTDPTQYGATIGTLLTPSNLCWVMKDSGQEIPGVECPAEK